MNALFFNDETMHKILEDEGKYNYIYQLPIVIYSTLISTVINNAIINLSLTEKNIVLIKNKKNQKKKDYEYLFKCLKIKFILYFILSFILLGGFWFYLGCFCIVYSKTQMIVIKDSLFSYGTNMILPFAICAFPGILRKLSLKKRKRAGLYKFSQTIQMI